MSETPQPLVNAGSLMATSISAQTVGGAMAVVFLAYHHIPDLQNGMSPQMLEDAFTLLFSTGISIFAMLCHLIIALVMKKYLPQT